MSGRKIIKKYFWDVDLEKADFRKHPDFIIERILEHGDEAGVQWLRKRFNSDEILRVLASRRRISPRSRVYWELMLQSWPTRSQKKLREPKRSRIWRR